MPHIEPDAHAGDVGCCLMEWIDLLIGGQVEITPVGPIALTMVKSAYPEQINAVISSLVQNLNDVTPDEERDQLIWLLPRILRCRTFPGDRIAEHAAITAVAELCREDTAECETMLRKGYFSIAALFVHDDIDKVDRALTGYEKGMAEAGMLGTFEPLVDPDIVDAMIASVLGS